jgi:hypothetical protein
MNTRITLDRPRWVMIASIALMLWNFIGIGAFIAQWQTAATGLDSLPPAQAAMWRAMPGWAWAAYGVAVGAGALGALGLVLKKAWAVPLFAISLVAVFIQFFNAFVLQDGVATVGAGALALPLVIIAISIVQVWLARQWQAARWLN